MNFIQNPPRLGKLPKPTHPPPPHPMKTYMAHTIAASSLLFGLTTMGSYAQTIEYDGILTPEDNYSNVEIVTWYNSHGSSSYGDFDSQYYNTFIRYGVGTVDGDTSGTQYFFLFAESPLEAKNMVWGDGMTDDEISQYGDQLSFSKATGSEKIEFVNHKGDSILKVDIGSDGKLDKKAKDFGLLSYKDSVMYLLDNGISTEDSSSASNFTMSVEMQFALDPAKNQLILDAARNGLDFHLSPDRGLIPDLVPEPSSTLLFGLLATLGLLRRKRSD